MSAVKNAYKHHLRVRQVCRLCDWLMQQESAPVFFFVFFFKNGIFISLKSNRNPLHNPADSPETSNNCKEEKKHGRPQAFSSIHSIRANRKSFWATSLIPKIIAWGWSEGFKRTFVRSETTRWMKGTRTKSWRVSFQNETFIDTFGTLKPQSGQQMSEAIRQKNVQKHKTNIFHLSLKFCFLDCS